MTQLDELTPVEPDTLAAIVADIEGALLPMMKSMLPEPDEIQWELLYAEMNSIIGRMDIMWNQKRVDNGYSYNT